MEEKQTRKNQETKIGITNMETEPLEKDQFQENFDTTKQSKPFSNISWKIIDKMFNDNPYLLVQHHINSYNDFFTNGIQKIFKQNNPLRFIEKQENTEVENEKLNEIKLYIGGKNGDEIFFGKPIINDEKKTHYMYPNQARLRNMTYAMTIHYNVDVDFTYYEGEEKKEKQIKLEKIYLGKFPIMLHSKFCILNDLPKEVAYNMGECLYDLGGYFIISGKEKTIVCQEKFADNMINVKNHKKDDEYITSAEIRSVSEDPSKPVRYSAVRIVAPSAKYSNRQIVVDVPNVRKPVPLFILMRALGVVSDKSIIETCLLDLDKNERMIDLFIPSIHEAGMIFNQETALDYIKGFTKRKTITGTLDILMNYFIPHIGELNFLEKAYFIGYMVYKMLKVYTKQEAPTDRDNFKYKRVELSGDLIYDLFREYYLIQKRSIELKIDTEFYFHKVRYSETGGLIDLIQTNIDEIFKNRIVEDGFKKAMKGNWGATTRTKKLGVVQDINRLSWNSFMSQLRKINLDLGGTEKIVAPRLLNSSQWGIIDPVDTPDGGNIGTHKHIAIGAFITNGYSVYTLFDFLKQNASLFGIKTLSECNNKILSNYTKIFANGVWFGVVLDAIQFVKLLKLYRRNGVVPIFTSITFNIESNTIYIYTDSGRLTRPIFYIETTIEKFIKTLTENKRKIESGSWVHLVSGFNKKIENYNISNNFIYKINEIFNVGVETDNENTIEKEPQDINQIYKLLETNKGILDYIDTSEEEDALISMSFQDLKNKSFQYTHLEIEPSLIFGLMGNQIPFPECNQLPRDLFSCGQSKQAVSLYNTNYNLRIDKFSVVLNYGQSPIIKTQYLKYFNDEKMPYGVNTIVAIMSYTGYNVEDAILINKGAIDRGLFRTTYYTGYQTYEETEKIGGDVITSFFSSVDDKNVVGTKKGFVYSYLDENGLIKENTPVDDKMVLIGKITSSTSQLNVFSDSSVFPKKGQLGFVDKSFITEGEEGHRIAKVRVREDRTPALGDKMASRVGQKGTIGSIINEEDMPYTEDGIKPDLIINPHALPSRMTIGQLVETLFGKACCMIGTHGDCTGFSYTGPNMKKYGSVLNSVGFHSSGNQILYNGFTGEQMTSEIFIGPTYYMRLKHMVKDKINYRAGGPRTVLTRQSVHGRANDGGLRIGEMERDGLIAHGMSRFLNESFLKRADEYCMAICNKTGCIAIYNSSLNLFLSPFADGPIQFTDTIDASSKCINTITKYGRSFSIVRIPYTLKLLIQELQVLNIQTRIITDANIDQILNMNYSNNINKVFDNYDAGIEDLIRLYRQKIETVNKNGTLDLTKTKSKSKTSRNISGFKTNNMSNITNDVIDDVVDEVADEFADEIVDNIIDDNTKNYNSPIFYPTTPPTPQYSQYIQEPQQQTRVRFQPMTPTTSPPSPIQQQTQFQPMTPPEPVPAITMVYPQQQPTITMIVPPGYTSINPQNIQQQPTGKIEDIKTKIQGLSKEARTKFIEMLEQAKTKNSSMSNNQEEKTSVENENENIDNIFNVSSQTNEEKEDNDNSLTTNGNNKPNNEETKKIEINLPK